MKLTSLFKEFFEDKKSSSILLILSTALSLLLANTLGHVYTDIWHVHFLGLSIEHWVNDGLMAVFFLLIGLEIEREIRVGELKKFSNALFPIIAACGGVVLPAIIYAIFNVGSPTFSGIGVPMATDIAFALGILLLLGKRAPDALKIFIVALAIIDDLLAIIIIALFYTDGINWIYLLDSFLVYGLLYILKFYRIYHLLPYVVGGIIMWYFMLRSGVHATIAGVLLAFVIPFSANKQTCPSHRLQHILHRPISFVILPVFALVNTAIILQISADTFTSPYALGIFFGLFLGKPVGIMLSTWISVQAGWTKLPIGLNWRHILGAGCLAGIGFTMSIFITLLAFNDTSVIASAKLIIILTSSLAGLGGYMILRRTSH